MAEQSIDRTGAERAEKYGSFETDEGETVLYDRDEPTAWLQSDTVAEVRE
jgi:hypothetical protein